MSVIALLGFASGLPLVLSDSTLQAWMAVQGVDVVHVGLFSLVGLPYVFKFLWAPLLDRFQLGWLSRRRDWTLLAQCALVFLLAYVGIADLASGPLLWLGAVAVCIAFISATQDIAVDAYRTEILSDSERGFGAATFVTGYRVAMLIAGAGALTLADQVGFANTYIVMAGLMLIGIAANIAAPTVPSNTELPRSLDAAVILPWRDFFMRKGAVWLLILVFFYKLGDAFAGRLTMYFVLNDLEFSLTEVGVIYKAVGLFATIGGGIYGGILMYRIGLYRSLILFAGLQALTNLGFCGLAVIGKSYIAMLVVVGLENLAGGMGTVAFVAFIMSMCNRSFTATQFALLTAFASIGRTIAGPPSGYLIDTFGWLVFFFLTFIIALPVLVLLKMKRNLIEELDKDAEGTC